jgi:hypothetical protein
VRESTLAARLHKSWIIAIAAAACRNKSKTEQKTRSSIKTIVESMQRSVQLSAACARPRQISVPIPYFGHLTALLVQEFGLAKEQSQRIASWQLPPAQPRMKNLNLLPTSRDDCVIGNNGERPNEHCNAPTNTATPQRTLHATHRWPGSCEMISSHRTRMDHGHE